MHTVMNRVETLDRLRPRERRAARSQLRRIEALTAQLAQLHTIRAVLGSAGEIVLSGWVQHGWFTVSVDGRSRALTAMEIGLTTEYPVTGACLVGAVVQGGGGPAEVRSQPVQRALDLIWHSLREDPERPVRWCPGPEVRTLHVLDLTHWNDAPCRTRSEVLELLRSTVEAADVQRHRCRTEQTALTGQLALWDRS